MGYRAFEEFAKLFPKKFINVGVSENNMIGIAAGMAVNGKKVFVYEEQGLGDIIQFSRYLLLLKKKELK